MRKKTIDETQLNTTATEQDWLNLDELVKVGMPLEHVGYPIESALLPEQSSGWRMVIPGIQMIRILFEPSQRLKRIGLHFVETHTERTQECIFRWSFDRRTSFHEIVRQQWDFSPEGTKDEIEDHQVDLKDGTVLELIIIPDISGGDALASLAQLQLA